MRRERERRLTDAAAVRRVPLLGPVECARVVGAMDALAGAWRRRGAGFFTLGAATYLDATPGGSEAGYRRTAAHDNPLLEGAFGDLLARIRGTVGELLDEPCGYGPGLAYPGFHIFLAGSLHAAMRDTFHLDLQFQHLALPATAYAPTLTFTLPVELPAAGAGIDFCRTDRADRTGPADKRGTVTTEPYRLGELLVHSGRTLHRRAHLPASPGCRRVTLQGHALRLEKREGLEGLEGLEGREGAAWILYW